MDDLHFVVANKKSQFKIKTQVGPFIYNTMEVGKEANFLLKKMKFKLNFTFSYDPFGIISKLKVEDNTTPYTHTQRPNIAKFMNQDQWEENTLHEAKEQVICDNDFTDTITKIEIGQEANDIFFPFNHRDWSERIPNLQEEVEDRSNIIFST